MEQKNTIVQKDKIKHTLSYAYLDDLQHKNGSPWNYEFEVESDYYTYENVENIINTIFKKAEVFQKLEDEKKYGDISKMDICFPSYWYMLMPQYKDEIIDDLMEKGYWVYNRYEKYYVIAFALDFVRFEVYSKDCDKKLIEWRTDDENDRIEGIIEDDNYNENPVVTLLMSNIKN